MSGPTSCRGILIAGVTNMARTQMAEAFLRSFTRNRIFIQSGGVQLSTGKIHPYALEVMNAIGLPLTGHTVHTLESARRQRATLDVLVSIDHPHEMISPPSSPCVASYVSSAHRRREGREGQGERRHRSGGHRGSDRYQQLASVRHQLDSFHQRLYQGEGHIIPIKTADRGRTRREEEERNSNSTCTSSLNLLFPSTPSHWTFGLDASDARSRSQLWSPADLQIAQEASTRRFQDHLYEGEPLFSTLEVNTMRKDMRFTDRWYIPEVHIPFATEREEEHYQRFVEAREELRYRCRELVRRLEDFYGEELLSVDEGSRRAGAVEEH